MYKKFNTIFCFLRKCQPNSHKSPQISQSKSSQQNGNETQYSKENEKLWQCENAGWQAIAAVSKSLLTFSHKFAA